MGRVGATETEFPGAGADVQGLARGQGEALAVRLNLGWSADVDQAEFAPGQKILRPDLPRQPGIERDRLAHRHRAADDDAVHMTVGERDLLWDKQPSTRNSRRSPAVSSALKWSL